MSDRLMFGPIIAAVAVLAPVEPHPDRDTWLTQQIANWTPCPPMDQASRLQDTVRGYRRDAARRCVPCDVTWSGIEPCFSCGNHPDERNPA